MDKINGYTLQKLLKQQEFVSVPWLQTELGLQYRDAKELLQLLMLRGWIKKEADGNRYPVVKENMKLRPILRCEVDTLCREITPDCAAALQRIRKSSEGATFSEIVSAVKGDETTKATIAVLTENRLAYEVDGLYFVCVSAKAVKVLTAVANAKRYSSARRRLNLDSDEAKELKSLFEELFEE